MRKRIAALALTVVMAFGSISAAAAAAKDTENTTDPTVERYYTVMSNLGAINSSIRNFNSSVRRSDLIKMIVGLGGYTAELTASEEIKLPYKDITNGDKDYDNVVVAYGMGFLPKDETEIRIGDRATVGEAAEMLINVLGYGKIADAGNMTVGVMANRVGITDGVYTALGDNLTYSDLVKMAYNALFTNVMEPQYFSENVTYGKGEILLTEAFDIEYGVGIVEANPITSIYAQNGCGWGNVRIDDVEYVTDRSFYDMIGHRVDYYYREESGKDNMVYMIDNEDNDVLTVETDDIQDFKERKLVYTDEKGRKQTENIQKSAVFLYNGKLKSFGDIETDKLCGSVSLIDNDNDNTYEVVSIVSYTHIVVDGVNAGEYKIIGRKDGQSYTVEEKENVCMVDLVYDGSAATVANVAIGDVVSVAQTDAGADGIQLIRAYISKKTVVGTVMYMDDEKIKVEDTVAEFEKGYIEPKLSGYGTFKYAFNGKLVAADMENYVVYGYLYAIKSTGIDGTIAKIFTDKGRWVELEMTDRVTFNGERANARDVMNASEFKYSDGKKGFKHQLVSYRINDKGKLNLLKTAKSISRYSAEEDAAINDGTFRLSLTKASGTYRSPLMSFDMEVNITGSTYIFLLPRDAKEADFDADDIKLKSSAMFGVDTSYSNMYFYDVSRKGTAAAMVIYDDTDKGIGTDDAIRPVVGLGTGLDHDGAACDVLIVKTGNREQSLVLKPGAYSGTDKIEAGDVVRYALDDNGEITNVVLYKDPSKLGLYSGNVYDRTTMIGGTTEYVDYDSNTVIIKYGSDNKRAIYDLSDISAVYKYDAEIGKVNALEKTDLTTDTDVFMHLRYGKVQEAVMYTNTATE